MNNILPLAEIKRRLGAGRFEALAARARAAADAKELPTGQSREHYARCWLEGAGSALVHADECEGLLKQLDRHSQARFRQLAAEQMLSAGELATRIVAEHQRYNAAPVDVALPTTTMQ